MNLHNCNRKPTRRLERSWSEFFLCSLPLLHEIGKAAGKILCVISQAIAYQFSSMISSAQRTASAIALLCSKAAHRSFCAAQFLLADFYPWFYIFLHSPRLLVRLVVGLLLPSLRFSISTFSSASFFGSLMILACGNNSFQDMCRLRHERHMGLVCLLMFCPMLSSISGPLKKGGNSEFLERDSEKHKNLADGTMWW